MSTASASLPNCFIVGVPKAGTTSMHHYLAQHPEIFMSPYKEPYYFASDLRVAWRIKNFEQYIGLFTSAENFRVRGESSVGYMYSEVAHHAIKEVCPQAKIIIMLRNPIDMMYSLHRQLLWSNHEDILNFEEALNAQSDRQRLKRIPTGCEEPKLLQYFDIATYSLQIKRYFDSFGRKNVHTIIFDDLNSHPAIVYRDALQFLGVSPDFTLNLEIHNSSRPLPSKTLRTLLSGIPDWRGKVRKILPPCLVDEVRNCLDKSLRPQQSVLRSELSSWLKERFRSDVAQVSQLLNRDLMHWVS